MLSKKNNIIIVYIIIFLIISLLELLFLKVDYNVSFHSIISSILNLILMLFILNSISNLTTENRFEKDYLINTLNNISINFKKDIRQAIFKQQISFNEITEMLKIHRSRFFAFNEMIKNHTNESLKTDDLLNIVHGIYESLTDTTNLKIENGQVEYGQIKYEIDKKVIEIEKLLFIKIKEINRLK